MLFFSFQKKYIQNKNRCNLEIQNISNQIINEYLVVLNKILKEIFHCSNFQNYLKNYYKDNIYSDISLIYKFWGFQTIKWYSMINEQNHLKNNIELHYNMNILFDLLILNIKEKSYEKDLSLTENKYIEKWIIDNKKENILKIYYIFCKNNKKYLDYILKKKLKNSLENDIKKYIY